jgi:hypothetical protein
MPYNDTTPWLQIPNWRPLQKYTQYPTHWYAVCTDLFKDPKKRLRWEKHGEGFLHLILEVWTQAASEGLYGIIWGDPCRLRREMGYKAPVDLGLLEAEHFIRYLTDEERGKEIARMDKICPELAEENRGKKVGKRRGDYRGEKKGQAQEQEQPQEQRQAQPIPSEPVIALVSEPNPPKKEPQKQQEAPSPADKSPPVSIASSMPSRPHSVCSPETAAIQDRSRKSSIGLVNPRGSAPDAIVLGSLLGPARLGEWDRQADDWVKAVMSALRLPWPAGTLQYRQNYGCLASQYQRLMTLPLPLGEKTEILTKDLKTAEEKSRAKHVRNRAAVFVTAHKARVRSHLERMRRPK